MIETINIFIEYGADINARIPSILSWYHLPLPSISPSLPLCVWTASSLPHSFPSSPLSYPLYLLHFPSLPIFSHYIVHLYPSLPTSPPFFPPSPSSLSLPPSLLPSPSFPSSFSSLSSPSHTLPLHPLPVPSVLYPSSHSIHSTPLHIAVRNGHIEIVKHLIEKGASILKR